MGETPTDDPFDLERFVQAQDDRRSYAVALEELRRGRKTSHWMWFVFPQIAGLGHSAMSTFAISSLEEARAYLRHDVLGPRLIECADILAAQTEGTTAQQIFGSVDAQKLHSSLTLFMRAAPDRSVFRDVLDRYFEGRPDVATDQRT